MLSDPSGCDSLVETRSKFRGRVTMFSKRTFLALLAAMLLAAASITPALAADEGGHKCNSGGHNQGGD